MRSCRNRQSDQQAAAKIKACRTSGGGHVKAGTIENGGKRHDQTPAEPVADCAHEWLADAPGKVLGGHREAEGGGRDAGGAYHGLHEQAQALAQPHGQ